MEGTWWYLAASNSHSSCQPWQKKDILLLKQQPWPDPRCNTDTHPHPKVIRLQSATTPHRACVLYFIDYALEFTPISDKVMYG